MGNGVTERSQFFVGGFQLRCPLNYAFLQFRIQPPYFAFSSLAFGNIADVTLNDLSTATLVDIADELNGDRAPLFGFQREVFIPDISILFQLGHHCLIGFDISERTQFSHGFS